MSVGICPSRAWRTPLILILAASFALRVVLVLRGGQLYFPDEGRYFRSVQFVTLFAGGDLEGAFRLILSAADHTGFALLGIIPAAIQYGIERLFGAPPEKTLWLPALFLSMMSVLCIALVAAIARRAGAGEKEALIAALLMASAASMFYFSRHLVPYDLSFAIALFAFWLGLDARAGFVRSFSCGVLAGFAFLTYNGYWLIAVLAGFIPILWANRSISRIITRGIAVGLGFVLFPVLLTLGTILIGMTPFVSAMTQFAGTVDQGTFSEGWSLPWEYFWDAEHGLLLLWAAGVAFVIWLGLRHREQVPARAYLWMGVAAAIYLPLSIGSTGLDKFVVYGRLAREMVPFLSLLTALAISYLWERLQFTRRLIGVGAIFLVMQVALNFWQPLIQQFPDDIVRSVQATYGPVGRALTVKGPPVFGYDPKLKPQYVLLNAQYIYPISGTRKPPAGRIVLQAAHPLEYLPYEFEGLDPGERAILQSTDISMRLIEAENAKP